MVKAKNYKKHLLKQLRDPKEATAYLNAAMNDDDPDVFVVALRDVAETSRKKKAADTESAAAPESSYGGGKFKTRARIRNPRRPHSPAMRDA